MAGWQPAGFGSTIDERTLVDEDFLPADGEPDGTELDERAGRDDLAAYRRSRRRARTRRLATGAAGLVGLGVVWQIAASILRETLKHLREKPEMKRDLLKLGVACCSPQKFELLQGAPQPALV